MTPQQRNQLEHLVQAGKRTARVTTLAPYCSRPMQVGLRPRWLKPWMWPRTTAFRIKRRFAEDGLAGALQARVQANRYRKVEDRCEAHLVALACSPAPEGHDHWTLRLLIGKVVELGLASSLSYETVRQRLKKRSPAGAEAGVVHSPVSADFVAYLKDVLDLYAGPYDPQRPVVCFEETFTKLLAETRLPLPPQPGHPLRWDYEYRREGTRNLFLTCEPLTGWRQVAITEQRTMQDFAQQMRWLVDEPTRR